ncbi:DUF3038 domain-containing protein [Planktothrix sp. FACHB-1365]|uniref:DUF3038 domain-containing protein n=1 Tax=Planktothrix sp. FACHB-1365 TaxID=2692855 RepID=UPI0016853C35|nr:DUF3038 domain-containing protein [Planktothrix sp. FACHB-1365]MBD2482097.1 DUF3038 domain-containing protein [Planktothrix sp. FACHB-1365]
MLNSDKADIQISNPNLKDLNPEPNPELFGKITLQIQLSLLAIEALTGIALETILQVGSLLKIETSVPDQIQLLQKHSDQNPLSIEEMRSLVLIICYIAQQDQVLIRRALGLVEQMAHQKTEFRQVTLLRDYLDTFKDSYQQWMTSNPKTPLDLDTLAIKLLIDLLFYSKPDSHQQLWLTLIESPV